MSGMVIVLSGPSGVGKGTIYKEILARLDNVAVSISVTTRAPRTGEIDGVQYFFVNKEQFKNMIDNNEFLEYAQTVDNYYGTPISQVEAQTQLGNDIILEIDVKGARQIKEIKSDCLSIFILPPSLSALERRLRGRNTESEEQIQKRLALAKEELEVANTFDFQVVNDNLEVSVNEIIDIIKNERKRRLDLC